MKIKTSVIAKYRIILYRRFMLRIAERIAKKENAKALVTGESLAQVSSQTLDNIATIEEVTKMPILRPLIGMDKEEIIKRLGGRKNTTHKNTLLDFGFRCFARSNIQLL